MEKQIINFKVLWDFASTKRQKQGEPVSVFSHIVPIIACSSNILGSIAVNRGYEAQVDSIRGLVFHHWGERYHTDPISTGEFGWEIPVYDTSLYNQKSWDIFYLGKKYTVELPPIPQIDISKTFLEMFGDTEKRVVHIAEGEWELIRQKVDSEDHYHETRHVVAGPLFMELFVDYNSKYDAFLITRPLWEEKIIMHGELNEK